MRGKAHRPKPYSVFGTGVDRKRALESLFPPEKAALHAAQKVCVSPEGPLLLGNPRCGLRLYPARCRTLCSRQRTAVKAATLAIQTA
jgi:hypothetical protein